jgi:HD-GYP domain-containing protein (c-di-GMP phosphodiesterase class II)
VNARDEIGLLGNVFHLMIERLAVSHRSIVGVLSRALEARDGGPGSLRRLADATLALADRLDITPPQREAIELGALLHDIGDVRTPEAVLQKPGRLSADEYALPARIFAAVDALDAMTHDRPWRRALAMTEALAAIQETAGTQFDPRVVDAVLKIGEAEWSRLLEVGRLDVRRSPVPV